MMNPSATLVIRSDERRICVLCHSERSAKNLASSAWLHKAGETTDVGLGWRRDPSLRSAAFRMTTGLPFQLPKVDQGRLPQVPVVAALVQIRKRAANRFKVTVVDVILDSRDTGSPKTWSNKRWQCCCGSGIQIKLTGVFRFAERKLRQTFQMARQQVLFPEDPGFSFEPTRKNPFSFIDLFAGIGGFRHGLQRLGGKCLFSCERDPHCAKTYEAWYGESPLKDINDVDPADIPPHDILTGGFPCQPFSIAGVSKKRSLGQADGFDCEKQGNLFFRICDIVKVCRPSILMLENVKNLKSHDKRRTWPVIEGTLQDLGYTVFHRIIDAADYVPQHRERIFIVCFDKEVFGEEPDFRFPEKPTRPRPKFRSILEDQVDEKYTLSDKLWDYLQRYAEKHRAKGNGFGFGIADPDGISRTLSARYYKDGSEILISQGDHKNPRRLTIVEAARLMGYGDIVKRREDVPISDTQAYRQFGNSVVPDVVTAVGKEILRVLKKHRSGQTDQADTAKARKTRKSE